MEKENQRLRTAQDHALPLTWTPVKVESKPANLLQLFKTMLSEAEMKRTLP